MIKSIYLNFRILPIKQAIKLPLIIYGKSKIFSLMGKCYIDAPVRTGMIQFGCSNKVIVLSCDVTYIKINGDVTFKGNVAFQNGVEFNVLSGTVVLGNNIAFGEKSRIVCSNFISVDSFTRFGPLSVLMDTNFHYILNLEALSINRCIGEIIIGKYCWIGSNSTLFKGTCLPDYTICSANSILSNDYSDIPAHSLLAGSPAKLIKRNLVRVWNKKNQAFLHNWFKTNADMKTYKLADNKLFEDFVF